MKFGVEDEYGHVRKKSTKTRILREFTPFELLDPKQTDGKRRTSLHEPRGRVEGMH